MAHDGFLGGFHDLAWPLAAHAASAAGAAPFDALQVQVQAVQHALMGAGAVWDHDASMGSLVSSPSPPPPPPPSSLAAAAGHEAALIEQLASRLGVSVPSPSPPPSSSRYASCYSTPVGSPSKPPSLLAAEAERAARLSCFGAPGGELSRVASSQSLLAEHAPAPAPAQAAAPGGAAAHQHASDGSSSDGPCRKRKAAPGGKAKAKDAVAAATPKSREPDTRAKKCKLSAEGADDEELKPAAHGSGKGKEVAAEPPKDYIHVRARRGQATDSHSLAERVRREKISERMKLLQDLVPGCSKVTGKAVMLDEIINYVQSLQRQVEFLSMKLATVNPRLELDVDSFIPKDANQPCPPAASSLPPPPPPPVYSLEGSSSALCYASPPATVAQSAVTIAKGFETQPPSFGNHGLPDHSLEGFQNANPQIGNLWEEDDLQSLVLMGFRGST